MNLEQLEKLQSFYTDLEEKEIICPKCASKLRKDTTFLLVGRNFTEAEYVEWCKSGCVMVM